MIVGILGGGQLARMTAQAAVSLTDEDAARLAAFVAPAPARSSLVAELRALVRR